MKNLKPECRKLHKVVLNEHDNAEHWEVLDEFNRHIAEFNDESNAEKLAEILDEELDNE